MDNKQLGEGTKREAIAKNGGACGVLNIVDTKEADKNSGKRDIRDIFILNDGTRLDETRLNGIIPIFKEGYLMDLQKLPLKVREYIDENIKIFKDVPKNIKHDSDIVPIPYIDEHDVNNNYTLAFAYNGLVSRVDLFRSKLNDKDKWDNLGEVDFDFDGKNFVMTQMEFVENGRQINIKFLIRDNKIVLVEERWIEEKDEVISGYRISGKIDNQFLYARQEWKSKDGKITSIDEDCSIDENNICFMDMREFLDKKSGWYKDFSSKMFWLKSYATNHLRFKN